MHCFEKGFRVSINCGLSVRSLGLCPKQSYSVVLHNTPSFLSDVVFDRRSVNQNSCQVSSIAPTSSFVLLYGHLTKSNRLLAERHFAQVST